MNIVTRPHPQAHLIQAFATLAQVAHLVLIMLAATTCPLSAHDDHSKPAGVVVETLAKTTQSWGGETLPAYPAGQPEVTILRITVPPGTALKMHKHPVINAGVLLSGTLVVTDDEKNQLTLHAGDPIVELVEKWHYGRNPGPEPAVIIVFYAGIQDMPVTVLKETK